MLFPTPTGGGGADIMVLIEEAVSSPGFIDLFLLSFGISLVVATHTSQLLVKNLTRRYIIFLLKISPSKFPKSYE
jgi:hypothetical protein